MAADDDLGLTELGVTVGARVRFRRGTGGWAEGQVERRERDGSVRLRDGKGAARAITVDRLQVRTTGPRGGATWRPLRDIAADTEQLRLL